MQGDGWVRRVAGAALFAICTPGLAFAQSVPEPSTGSEHPAEVDVRHAVTECVTELQPDPGETITHLSCEVVLADTLRYSDGGVGYAVRYHRWVRASALAWRDSLQVAELLVFEAAAPDAASARLAWRRYEIHDWLGPFQFARSAHGDLRQLYTCTRGTGGCSEEVSIRLDGRWLPIELAFLEGLEPHLPPGYRLHKGRRIDLATLAFEQPIATRDDPNCCPSASLYGSLRLEGLSLVLDELVTRR